MFCWHFKFVMTPLMTRSTKGYKIFILVIPGISIDPQSRYEMILFMMNNQTIGRTTQNTFMIITL